MLMWLVKLPFRILALPILLLVGTIAIFCKIFLYAGSFAAGLAYLVLALCIVEIILQHNYMYLIFILVAGAGILLCMMFAGAISLGLDALTGKIFEFILT